MGASFVILSNSAGDEKSISHPTHLAAADGPQLGSACDTCHDTNNLPYFKSGTDVNGDSHIDLAETDICDTCHIPGGIYNGVDDTAIGAKANCGTAVSISRSMILLPAMM